MSSQDAGGVDIGEPLGQEGGDDNVPGSQGLVWDLPALSQAQGQEAGPEGPGGSDENNSNTEM